MQTKPFQILLGLSLLLVLLSPLAAVAQEGEFDAAAMQEAWEKAMSPGEPHQWLTKMVGEWTYETSMWMNPEAPPEKVQGESTKTMVMDGRYLQEEMRGEMMGQPFHGRGLTGYDNVRQEMVGTWIDNMNTGIAVVQGELDVKKKTIVMRGQMADPGSGQELDLELVTRAEDDDHHTFEYYVILPDGNKMKQMEIRYVRKSAGSDS